jgi:hypothetical protein
MFAAFAIAGLLTFTPSTTQPPADDTAPADPILFAYPNELLGETDTLCSESLEGVTADLTLAMGGETVEARMVCALFEDDDDTDLEDEWLWGIVLDHVPTIETRQAVLACKSELRERTVGTMLDTDAGDGWVACDSASDLLRIEGGSAALLVDATLSRVRLELTLNDPVLDEVMSDPAFGSIFGTNPFAGADTDEAITFAIYTEALLENYATAASPPSP